MLKTITLTGADERTSVDALVNLVASDPRVEVGLLYTATPEGRNRYPSLEWLKRATSALGERCAVHICGGTARRQLLALELASLIGPVGRIQVNGALTAQEVQGAAVALEFANRKHLIGQPEAVGASPDFAHRKTVITQHQAANAFMAPVHTVANHVLLVDGSGGRGISPEAWVRPESSKAVGFAGGLGPANLQAELPRIAAVATGDSWVDMEGRLRVEDWFDIGLARECAAVFAEFSAPAPLSSASASTSPTSNTTAAVRRMRA